MDTPTRSHDPVLIAGAGIAGLAAALALARKSIPSIVLEKRAEPSESGAGIQIGPNGTRILRELGAADALAKTVAVPGAIRVHDGRDGRALARLPLGAWIERRHGAPYWVAHRQDLHAALLAAARAHSMIEIATAAEVVDIRPASGAVEAITADGRPRRGRALIGADGLWSRLRRETTDAAPAFTNLSAVRATIPAERVPRPDMLADTFVWLSSAGHIVHYPVRGGKELAVVGIFKDDAIGRDWSSEVDPRWVADRGKVFPPDAAALLVQDRGWRKWGLNTLAYDFSWSSGRIALIGDAAHPVMPFLAQGAVLALEDAVVLADCLSGAGEVASALRTYEQIRRPRASAVAAASRRNGRIYHLSGALAAARNLALAALPGERIMAGYDWLYGWRR